MSTMESQETTVESADEETLVEIRDLKTYYGTGFMGGKPVKAVDGVTFDIKRGETLGLVGESGCGKTTLGRTLMQLETATGGTIRYQGVDVTSLSGQDLKRWRRNVQMVFQDPDSSLNERMTIGEIIREPLDVHDWPYLATAIEGQAGATVSGKRITSFDGDVHQRPDIIIDLSDDSPTVDVREGLPLSASDVSVSVDGEDVSVDVRASKKQLRRARVRDLLETVGLQPEHYYRYPHQFSGGQKQRIGIARALALEPDFIVLDEPVSALDASVQAKILNLLGDLQEKFELTYLFIAHDLSVVEHICDRVAVMYLGHIMELGPNDELFDNPANPYTHALLSAIPEPDPTATARRITLRGTPPSPRDPPTGCPFSTRCPMKVRPPKYRDLDGDVWEAVEVFRDVLRQRKHRDRTIKEQIFELVGIAEPFENLDELDAELFGDVDLPSEVRHHVDHAFDLIRSGEVDQAREYLREEFASECESEPPEDYQVSDTGRWSHCHRHKEEHESPDSYLQSHLLD